MNFEELLQAYKKGETTPEQARMVEEEIEKNKLINDYICGEIELDPPEKGDTSVEDTPNKESVKAVKRIMRRTLLKVAAIAAGLVLAGLLITNYIISPLVASRYYDPTKVIEERKSSRHLFPLTQGELDTKASFELTVYSDILSSYYANDMGYGKYHIHMMTQDLFTSEYKSQEDWITKGLNHMELKQGYWFTRGNTRNRFGRLYFTDPEAIHNIAQDMVVEAAVLFPEDRDMDQLVSIMDEYSDLYYSWAAVRNTSNMPSTNGTEPNIGNLGFRPLSIYSADETPPSIEELYPNLFLTSGYTPTADELTQHFMSLLTYVCDRGEENVEAYHYSRSSKHYAKMAWHKNTLKLIQKNGIQIYGVVVIGKYEDVVSLYENGVIIGIQIYDTRSSVYQNEKY